MTDREKNFCYDLAKFMCYPDAFEIGGTATMMKDIIKNITKKNKEIRKEVLENCKEFVSDNEEDFQVGDYVKVKSSDKIYLIKQIKEIGVLVSDIINSSSDFEFLIDKSIISEKVTKFDPEWLKPFDRVLVRESGNERWRATLFSHIDEKWNSCATSDHCNWRYCIPFNDETKHLVGTPYDEPEFYEKKK